MTKEEIKKIRERKIGETFQFEGHQLRVVEGGRYKCEECFFYNRDCSSMMHVHGFCCVGIMTYNVDRNAWHWISEKPTHWFPIPELPKEKE